MDLYSIDLATNTRKVFASFKGSNTGGSFSRDGSKVALILTSSGNAEVWTANASGGGFKKLTNTKATESSPGFSPDGSKVVFASDFMGGPQIYTMPSSGGKMQRVNTRMSGYCSEPAWNPRDPNKIAFTAAAGKGFQVAVYDFKVGQFGREHFGRGVAQRRQAPDMHQVGGEFPQTVRRRYRDKQPETAPYFVFQRQRGRLRVRPAPIKQSARTQK